MVPKKESSYTLRDVEVSLSVFSGSGLPDVIQFISEFEEMASIVKCSSLQMFLYGRQLIVGAAKLFVKSERDIKDWSSLKKALLNEFGEHISAADVHRQLRSRRQNRNESLIEYFYAMREICSKVDLDDNGGLNTLLRGFLILDLISRCYFNQTQLKN